MLQWIFLHLGCIHWLSRHCDSLDYPLPDICHSFHHRWFSTSLTLITYCYSSSKLLFTALYKPGPDSKVTYVAGRIATIQCVAISMYCLWCITMWAIYCLIQSGVRTLFCVTFKKNKWFFSLRNIMHHVGWPQCTIIWLQIIKTSHNTSIYHNTQYTVSIRFDFLSIHRYRLKTIQYTIYCCIAGYYCMPPKWWGNLLHQVG